MPKKKKPEPNAGWLVTLDGCRVGRAPTYREAEKLAKEFEEQYPRLQFKIKSAPAS